MCGRRTGRDSSRKRRNVRACSRAMHPQRASGMPKTPQEARDPARSSALMDASSDAISQDHRGNGVLRYLDRSHPSFAIGASSRMHRLARNAYRRMPQHCNRTAPTAILPCLLRLSSVLRHLRYRILVPSSMSCPPRLPSARAKARETANSVFPLPKWPVTAIFRGPERISSRKSSISNHIKTQK